MISVCMMTRSGRLCGFTSTGHADYDEKGKDIVCAAVSALTQTCVMGLTEIVECAADVQCSERDGIQCLVRPETEPSKGEQAELLLKTLHAGLVAIREAYPGTLKIRVREV